MLTRGYGSDRGRGNLVGMCGQERFFPGWIFMIRLGIITLSRKRNILRDLYNVGDYIPATRKTEGID